MAIAIGGNQINKAYLGGNEVQKMYLGSTLIFDNTTMQLKPTITNFRIESGQPSRVYFDTLNGEPVGLSTVGFIVSNNTITGVDTSAKYFSLGSAYSYWDNGTIRLENGNDVVYDFTLEDITNNIPAPTPTRLRYVSVNGSGSGDGSSQSNEWTFQEALSNGIAGDKIYLRKGNYANAEYTVSTSGSEANPITFEGYDTAPGDSPTLIMDGEITFNENVMPLFDGGGIGVSGRIINGSSKNYMIWKNLQFQNKQVLMEFGGTSGNIVVDNCYYRYAGIIGLTVSGSYAQNKDCKLINSYLSNCTGLMYRTYGSSTLIDNNYFYQGNSGGVAFSDYYISIYGGVAGAGSNVITNNHVEVDPTASGGSRHGISIKASGGISIYNLIKGNTVLGQKPGLEIRHDDIEYNVCKNNFVDGNGVSDTTGIEFRGGAANNIAEYNTISNVSNGIRYGNGETSTSDPSSTNNVVRNSTFENLGSCIQTAFRADKTSALSQYNKIQNCTFIDATQMFELTDNIPFDDTNVIENCIFEDVRNLYNTTTYNNGAIPYDFAFTYSDIWACGARGDNSSPGVITDSDNWITPIGTGVFEIDPQLDVNLQPQATFADIDVPKITGINYDRDGNERQDPTTVGGILSPSEAAVDVPFTITSYEISEITATTAQVRTYINEQCSINYYVDGVKNAASSDDFDANEVSPNNFRHTRTLTGLTPGITANLIIEVTAEDDLEVVQSGNIPLTTTGLAIPTGISLREVTPVIPTVTVSNTDGTADFSTIQAAVDSGLVAGDIVGLKGGDEFYESVVIDGIDNITFTSYGTGKATITGGEEINGWSDEGSNIWSADVTGKTVYNVTKDDQAYRLASYPKTTDFATVGNVYEIDSVNGLNNFTCSSLIGFPDLVGGNAHVMVHNTRYRKREISAFNSSTGEVTLTSDANNMTANSWVFVSNKLALLDATDEWYYDSSTDKLYVYSVGTPTGIIATTLDGDGIAFTNSASQNISNIVIKQYNINGISLNGDNNIVDNVDFYYCTQIGVNLLGGFDSQITNNYIKGTLAHGILCDGVGALMQYNYIYEIGMVKDFANNDISSTMKGITLETNSNGCTVINNKIEKIGLSNVRDFGQNNRIEQNYFLDWTLTLHDVGAISTWNSSQAGLAGVNLVIDKNVMINTKIPQLSAWHTYGVYLDDNSHDITITNNSVSGGLGGYFYHNTFNLTASNNKSYMTVIQGVALIEDGTGAGDDTVINNDLLNSDYIIDNLYSGVFKIKTIHPLPYDFGTSNNNQFYNLAFNDVIRREYDGNQASISLSAWQSESSQDLASGSSADASSITDTDFLYNETDEVVVKTITGQWSDLRGNQFDGSVILQPYSSVILIQPPL